jgi:cyclase
MLHPRVIPCLLLSNGGLVKTIKFGTPRYIGDPINAVRIFNDKEVDELVFLDIDAGRSSLGPNFELLSDITAEAFMPFGYGGGISNLDQVKQLYQMGVEKVIINSAAEDNPNLISDIANLAGSSGLVVSIDVRRNWVGKYSVCVDNGLRILKRGPIEFAQDMEKLGAGEILLNAIDRDGTMCGFDTELIRQISECVSIPVVAVGGAGTLAHFQDGINAGASAVAAGSMFIYHGKHRAVLISYPEYKQLVELFS